MKIIDNALDKNCFTSLKNAILSEEFPWHYAKVVEPHQLLCDETYNSQFYHFFYDSYKPVSSYIDLLNPILNILKPKALIRIKANMILKTFQIMEHGYHTDQPFDDFKTAIYYVNSNDGCTKFKNGNFVQSVENRLIEFDGSALHTGTTCTDECFRVVINFNYM